MIDNSTHKFTCSSKGVTHLSFITVAVITAVVFFIIITAISGIRLDTMELRLSLLGMVVIIAYAAFALYCDWRTLSL